MTEPAVRSHRSISPTALTVVDSSYAADLLSPAAVQKRNGTFIAAAFCSASAVEFTVPG